MKFCSLEKSHGQVIVSHFILVILGYNYLYVSGFLLAICESHKLKKFIFLYCSLTDIYFFPHLYTHLFFFLLGHTYLSSCFDTKPHNVLLKRFQI